MIDYFFEAFFCKPWRSSPTKSFSSKVCDEGDGDTIAFDDGKLVEVGVSDVNGVAKGCPSPPAWIFCLISTTGSTSLCITQSKKVDVHCWIWEDRDWIKIWAGMKNYERCMMCKFHELSPWKDMKADDKVRCLKSSGHPRDDVHWVKKILRSKMASKTRCIQKAKALDLGWFFSQLTAELFSIHSRMRCPSRVLSNSIIKVGRWLLKTQDDWSWWSLRFQVRRGNSKIV